MEKVVSSTRLKTDPVCRSIITYLGDKSNVIGLDNAILYYDFPLFRDYDDELYQPSLLILDAILGVVVISVSETAFDIARDDDLLEEFHALLHAKFLTSRRLRKSITSLKFEINTILYLPSDSNPLAIDYKNHIVKSLESLQTDLMSLPRIQLTADDLQEIRSIIEGFKALAKTKARDIAPDGSQPKAEVLRKLEEEIANFDAHQRTAALTVALGPQRIRGLAGSGKTIILAWKAAHILLTDPTKKILFTFYTKSLYDLIRKQITRFYRHFRDSDPDWSNLHVLHAWGGSQEAGVYYNTCMEHGVFPKRWDSVKNLIDPFKFICEELTKKTNIEPKYDVVLVDEAQDLPDSFFHLLFHLTKGQRDEKTIIWAYDEFQSIFQPKMRTPGELFGLDADGSYRVDLDRSAKVNGLSDFVSNDLVLYKCYRNPLDVLVCSHALGLGIYGGAIVQMLQDKDHWEDIGYEVEVGEFVTNSPTIIRRPEQNSPLSILEHESRTEIVKCFKANNLSDELDWIVNETLSLFKGGLLPDDILVICLDDRNAKTYFGALSTRFANNNISTHDALANPFTTSYFKVEGKVTLSTVHRAKGNEAAVVFAAGVDALSYSLNGRKARNKIFTAFTRAKCWLRVSGMDNAAPIFDEIEQALGNSPKLVFNWPDMAVVEMLQRDISTRQKEAKKLKSDYMKKMAELGFSEEEALASSGSQEKSI
ncbi:MAG TPA: ATP-binding domain-containing protein [Methylophilaceae bacterium]|jgi:superfamily I DNA and RNA helicase